MEALGRNSKHVYRNPGADKFMTNTDMLDVTQIKRVLQDRTPGHPSIWLVIIHFDC
jgi:hypothetical protein